MNLVGHFYIFWLLILFYRMLICIFCPFFYGVVCHLLSFRSPLYSGYFLGSMNDVAVGFLSLNLECSIFGNIV